MSAPYIRVTPSLRIDPDWVDCVDNAAVAADWIEQGNIAYVPSIEVAREVLEIIGLSEDEIDDRIHFGLTGRIL